MGMKIDAGDDVDTEAVGFGEDIVVGSVIGVGGDVVVDVGGVLAEVDEVIVGYDSGDFDVCLGGVIAVVDKCIVGAFFHVLGVDEVKKSPNGKMMEKMEQL